MPSRSPASVPAGRNIPQQASVSAIQTEDQQMQRFLSRVQWRDDSQQLISDSASGPTVPTALSRRMFQRQGVGYLDDSVAAIASASADRFLATVLHQAVACRDQRLKGAEMAKGAKRHRKRHADQFQAASDDRRRRKEEDESLRDKANLAAVAAVDALKKGGSVSKNDVEGTAKAKKKQKLTSITGDTQANGIKKLAEPTKPDRDDDEESFDSLDEEEIFYQNYYCDQRDSDDSDEEDEPVRLPDLRRPLEAWGFHIAGKLGLDSAIAESDSDEINDEEADENSEKDNDDDGGVTNNDIVGSTKEDIKSAEAKLKPPASPRRPSKSASAKASTPN